MAGAPDRRSPAEVRTWSDLLAAGMSRHMIRHALAAGRWQRLAPRVYWTASGPVPYEVRVAAAVVAAGAQLDDASAPVAVSHATACLWWHVRDAPDDARVHVLVPHARQVRAGPGVVVHRSRNFDARDVVVRAGLPVTTLERAVVDTCTTGLPLDAVRALLAAAVQDGRTTVSRLSAEADRLGAAPRTAALRRALAGVAAGDRSAAEATLYELVVRARVPLPERLVAVPTRRGRVVPDLLWRELGLACEVDGREWHLSPADWADDLDRQNALHEAGFVVLRFPAQAVFERPGDVVTELRDELARRQALRDLRRSPG